MKIAVKTIDGGSAGEIELAEAVFGRPRPPGHPAARVVTGSSPSAAPGTHKTKGRGEVDGDGQEDVRARRAPAAPATARGARRSSAAAARRSARSCAAMPSTCRRRCASSRLRTALSAKAAEGKLVVLDDGGARPSRRPPSWRRSSSKLGCRSVLVIDGAEVDANFARAARNIAGVDVLPQQGANVYDILRRDTLVLTRDAVEASRGAPGMSVAKRPAPIKRLARAHVRGHPLAGDHREGDQRLASTTR